MMPFRRAPPPVFWSGREGAWLERVSAGTDAQCEPLYWQHGSRFLAEWFHGEVRAREPGATAVRLCAYCDGELGTVSPQTIDHFFPRGAFPVLALCWDNLYPACHSCNSTHKRTRWSCHALRPDLDPIEKLFDFDPLDGRLLPALEEPRRIRARVRLTSRLFGLNTAERCTARLLVLRNLKNAWALADHELVRHYRQQGPYRIVVEHFVRSLECVKQR